MIFQNGSYKIFVLGSECFDSIDNNTKMAISQDHVNGLGLKFEYINNEKSNKLFSNDFSKRRFYKNRFGSECFASYYSMSNNTSNNTKMTISQDHVNRLV